MEKFCTTDRANEITPQVDRLQTIGIEGVRETNQIANYALVEWDDNIAISDVAPAKYWPKYAKRFTSNELATMCRWHALPDNRWDMDYEQFLAARRPLISLVIRDGYRKLAENAQ